MICQETVSLLHCLSGGSRGWVPAGIIQPRQDGVLLAFSNVCMLQQKERDGGGKEGATEGRREMGREKRGREEGREEGGGRRIFTFLLLLSHFDQANFVCLKTQNCTLWGQIPRNNSSRHHCHSRGDGKR